MSRDFKDYIDLIYILQHLQNWSEETAVNIHLDVNTIVDTCIDTAVLTLRLCYNINAKMTFHCAIRL